MGSNNSKPDISAMFASSEEDSHGQPSAVSNVTLAVIPTNDLVSRQVLLEDQGLYDNNRGKFRMLNPIGITSLNWRGAGDVGDFGGGGGGGDWGGGGGGGGPSPDPVDKNLKLSSIGGLDSHIGYLKRSVIFPMIHKNSIQQWGVDPPKGIMFYGPPGELVYISC
jgi:hypothetical protein